MGGERGEPGSLITPFPDWVPVLPPNHTCQKRIPTETSPSLLAISQIDTRINHSTLHLAKSIYPCNTCICGLPVSAATAESGLLFSAIF